MNGFKDDILSILRDNVMLHGEAMGYIMQGAYWDEARELVEYLQENKYPVTEKASKPVLNYDYIVIYKEVLSLSKLFYGLSLLSNLGILIVDITKESPTFRADYNIKWAGFRASKLIYGTRAYLVLRKGMDYGN